MLKIHIQKTMTVVFGQENIIEELIINNMRIENVIEFLYQVCIPTNLAYRPTNLGLRLQQGNQVEDYTSMQLVRWLDSRKYGTACA